MSKANEPVEAFLRHILGRLKTKLINYLQDNGTTSSGIRFRSLFALFQLRHGHSTKIQNTALRICCGAMPSTPIIALQHSCKELPVRLRHLYACLQYRSNLLSLERHPCIPLVTPSWHEIWPQSENFKTFNMLTALDISNNFEQEKYKLLDDPPWKLPTLSIDLELTQHEQTHPLAIRNRCLDYIEKYKYHVRIYTDGSKSDSACGCATFVENDKTSRKTSLPKTGFSTIG